MLTGYALNFWRKQEGGRTQTHTQTEKCGIKPATRLPCSSFQSLPHGAILKTWFHSTKKVHVPARLSAQFSPIRETRLFGFCDHLTQDVQVDGCGFHQSTKYLLNVLNIEALLWLPLPTAQHHIVHFLGAEPGPLQHPTLRDALYHLQKNTDTNISLSIIQLPA